MTFKTTCLECWKTTSQDALDMNCHTCEHCGHHKHGARQQQLGAPCTLEVNSEE